MGKLFELFLKNLIILHIGVTLRFIYLRFLKNNNKITYSKLLKGIEPVKSKEDDLYNIKNQTLNRLYALIFLFAIVIIFIIVKWRFL